MPVAPDLLWVVARLRWPLVIFVAWLAGEWLHRRAGVPRIGTYGGVGFAAAALPDPAAPLPDETMLLLANVAFGLVLFEFGYRINIDWLRANRWLAATGLSQATATFAAVLLLGLLAGTPATTALLLAALAMSTSPAGVLRVVNESRSAGQVTERALHLAAIGCVLAVITYKLVVGLVVFRTADSALMAVYSSVVVVAVSVALGGLLGSALPALLRGLAAGRVDGTLAYAVGVVLLVTATHALKLSPVVATLTFGLVVRRRRVVLSAAQRGFGSLGDLMTVFLFVFIASTLSWPRVVAGLGLGLALVAVRTATQVAAVLAFARLSGTTWRKGALTGLALAPMSAFVILVLEQTRHLGVDLVEELAPLAAATLALEILGPIVTQRALILAGEAAERKEPRDAA